MAGTHLYDLAGNPMTWAELYARHADYYARVETEVVPTIERPRYTCSWPECHNHPNGNGHWCHRHRYAPRAMRMVEAMS